MNGRIILFYSLTIVFSFLLISKDGYAQRANDNFRPYSGLAGKDAAWIPTPLKIVDAMLDMANVTSADYVIDLGSGDGRFVIAAAKRGAQALGIEYNPNLVELAKRAAIAEGVSERAQFNKADLFESDFSKATVLTLFLLTNNNIKLRTTILDMTPGTRIVSNTFGMDDWIPDQTDHLTEISANWNTIHLWIVPAKVSGIWKIPNGTINFVQEFQNITGTITVGNKEMIIAGKLNGNNINFNAGGVEYSGTVNGDTISGMRANGVIWKAVRYIHSD